MSIFLLFLLTTLFPLNTDNCIELEGNKLFSKEEIIGFLNLEETFSPKEKDIEKYSRRLLEIYKNDGFLDAKIDCKIENNRLIIGITEGRKFTVGTIEVKGNKFIKDELLIKFSGIKSGALFSIEDFEWGMNGLLDFYGSNGFPFTRIIPFYFKKQDGRINIGLEIEEGPRLRWGEITVLGNRVTKDYVIKKQLRIPKGEYFSETRLKRSYEWLNKLSFVERENEFLLIKGERSGTVDIVAKVNEVNSNRITGIIGYIPSENGEEGGFVGSVTTDLLNLFGTGRMLSLQWQKEIPPYTKLDVSYKEPWLLASQLNLISSFSHFIEDTLFTFSKVNLNLQTALSINLTMGLVTGWEKFTAASIGLPDSKKYTLGTEFQFNNLDDKINPRRGIDYHFYTEYGKKNSVDIMKFTLDLFQSFPIFSNNAITFLLSGKGTRTNDPPLPEYEQFRLGGYNSLRGYRDRQFRTTEMLRLSPEYRYLVSRKSRLYLLYDCAYFETTSYPDGLTKDWFKDGYGIGAKILSGLGIISIEYALGEERTFMKGKIHIGIDTTF